MFVQCGWIFRFVCDYCISLILPRMIIGYFWKTFAQNGLVWYLKIVRNIIEDQLNLPLGDMNYSTIEYFISAIYDRYLLKYRVLWLRMRARWQITGIRLCNNGVREAKGSTHRAFWVQHLNYRKIYNIRRTKSQNLNNFRLVSQLPLPNPLKPGVKLRMHNSYCLIFCTNLIYIYISDLYRRSKSSWYSTQSMTWNPVILLNTMPVGDILQHWLLKHFLGNNQAYLQWNLLQQNTNVKVYCTREVTQMRTM